MLHSRSLASLRTLDAVNREIASAVSVARPSPAFSPADSAWFRAPLARSAR